MKLTKEMMRLYAVTDRSWLRGQTLFEQVEHLFLRLRGLGMGTHYDGEACLYQGIKQLFAIPRKDTALSPGGGYKDREGLVTRNLERRDLLL